MASHLFSTEPLPEAMLTFCQLDPWRQTSVKIESKYKLYLKENALKFVVCKKLSIVFIVLSVLSMPFQMGMTSWR